MLAFLCGAMEHSPDGGQQWRERMRLWLQETLNHRVYDPTQEARRLLNEEESRNLPRWKTSDFERYRRILRLVIDRDLDIVTDQADYVVCLWDEAAARGGGTQAELTAAYRKGIPVYLVTEMPLGEISGWVLSCTDKIFASLDGLKSFLAVAYGKEARQRVLWGG